jgi:GT2 family glycosyltransferase
LKITAVSVTYGERFNLLNQVIDALIKENVNEIWIVDNNSNPLSREKLLEKANKIPLIKVFSLSENKGSAGAYFEVLQYAFSFTKDQFFWFLDDDNLPMPGALNSLLKVFEERKTSQSAPVLYSYRGLSWEEDRRAVRDGFIKGPNINSFCGFQLKDLLKNNEKNENKILTPDEVKFPVVPTHWGPYGGLFTTIENLKKIGLPNKELVVYADDQDYTLRFHLAGISQFLVYSSQIQDIDESIGEGGGYFSEKTSLTKLFYGLRNTTYLSKKLVTNPIVYFANKYAFFLILGLLGIKAFPKSPTLVFNRMRWFFKAFKDGENGMLGLETSL